MTPSTKRSQAAAKEILPDGYPCLLNQEGVAAIIASHYAELEAAAVLARDALKSTADFADCWDKKPIRGLSDALYCIHGEAEFRLSDCRKAKAVLSALDAALAQDSKTPLERGDT